MDFCLLQSSSLNCVQVIVLSLNIIGDLLEHGLHLMLSFFSLGDLPSANVNIVNNAEGHDQCCDSQW
jgi:hypothetical protein